METRALLLLDAVRVLPTFLARAGCSVGRGLRQYKRRAPSGRYLKDVRTEGEGEVENFPNFADEQY